MANRDATLLERAGSALADVGSLGAGRPRVRRAVLIVLLAIVVAFLVGFAVTQWNRLPDFEWRFEPGWLAVSIVCMAGFLLAAAALWRVILRLLGERLPASAARAVWGQSLLARYVPTNALMVLGRVVLAEREGVGKRACLASIVYEIGIGLCAALIVGAYFALTLPSLEDVPARFAVLAVVPAVLVVLHPRVFARIADFGLEKLGREALPSTLPFSRVLLLALAYVANWCLIGVAVFSFARALYPIGVGDLPFVAASYSVAFCVAVLTFVVPSGIGTRDAALAASVAVVLPATVATAIAIAFRLLQTAVELAFVGAVTLVAHRVRANGT